MGCPGKQCSITKPCISNTSDFINSFTAIQNVTAYQSLRDSAQYLAKAIKNDNSISADNKLLLKGFYNDVYNKSEQMYNSIVADLTSVEKRKEIKNNFTGYVQTLNNQFDNIKAANQSLVNQYRDVTATSKGFLPLWLVQTALWPIAKNFINEIINDRVEKLLNKHLKPVLVLKTWENV